MFSRIAVLTFFAKFTENHLCHSFFHKTGELRPATSLKKRLWHRCFPVNSAKFLEHLFIEIHWWLLFSWEFFSMKRVKINYVVPFFFKRKIFTFSKFYLFFWECRSNHAELFCKKGVFKNFAKFTEKNLCWSLFFNKALGLQLQCCACVFFCEFWEFFKNTFFREAFWTIASEIRIRKHLGCWTVRQL